MKAFAYGRLVAVLATLLVGLGLWVFTTITNAVHYTEVLANVDRVEEVCVPVGESGDAATAARCAQARLQPAGKWWHRQAVHVRYQSPADGQAHAGVVVPVGGKSAVEALKLRPGDRWTILARNDNPRDIKAR